MNKKRIFITSILLVLMSVSLFAGASKWSITTGIGLDKNGKPQNNGIYLKCITDDVKTLKGSYSAMDFLDPAFELTMNNPVAYTIKFYGGGMFNPPTNPSGFHQIDLSVRNEMGNTIHFQNLYPDGNGIYLKGINGAFLLNMILGSKNIIFTYDDGRLAYEFGYNLDGFEDKLYRIADMNNVPKDMIVLYKSTDKMLDKLLLDAIMQEVLGTSFMTDETVTSFLTDLRKISPAACSELREKASAISYEKWLDKIDGYMKEYNIYQQIDESRLINTLGKLSVDVPIHEKNIDTASKSESPASADKELSQMEMNLILDMLKTQQNRK